jgi:hypothetical protein
MNYKYRFVEIITTLFKIFDLWNSQIHKLNKFHVGFDLGFILEGLNFGFACLALANI